MSLTWSWIGRVPYGQALEQQRKRREEVINGKQPEILWMLEHDPVITTGRRTVPDLISEEALQELGIDLYKTERGGLATYHGPGQLVAYPIIDCWKRGIGVKGTIHAMEQSVMDWLGGLGLKTRRRPGFPGVWVSNAKICAVGMHFKRGVSMHGLAVNLSDHLKGFNHITPCGISNAEITSVNRELGIAMTTEEAARSLGPRIIHNLLNPICTMAEGSRQVG